jgi:hypothetical protein
MRTCNSSCDVELVWRSHDNKVHMGYILAALDALDDRQFSGP